ncbi:odorant receptor 85c-like [Teleopsis dalmanni]|uniref:odorant receptor 85c-like n=1 Tax=Teleopsis dalmanni TaxID=139649 RepID=UPI0018CEBDBD|nr:odorant receptor 85c-like [Teleopsis dalmanni]
MSSTEIDKFMNIANSIYKCLGIVSYHKTGRLQQRSWTYAVIFAISVFDLATVALAETTFIILNYRNNNYADIASTFSYLGFAILGLFKILFVLYKKKDLTNLMKQLEKLFPKNNAEKEQIELKKYLNYCRNVSIGFTILNIILIATYNLYAITEYLLYERLLKTRIVGKNLPYVMYIPWDWRDNWTYYFLYAFEDLAGFVASTGQLAGDLTLSAVSVQLIMHYDNIARLIAEYKVKATENSVTYEKDYKEDVTYLANVVVYHEAVLKLADITNSIFGIPLLVNFMSSSFIICFVGFQIALGAPADAQIKLFLFLVALSAQVYLVCHHGQLLIDSSVGISYAVYEHNWINADTRFKKMLVFMARRAQQPALLKATVFVDISRSTMTDVIQMSYKFFALLRTMYSD